MAVAGGFFALFSALVTAIYIGALLVAIFVINAAMLNLHLPLNLHHVSTCH
jgi:hypothetical protein